MQFPEDHLFVSNRAYHAVCALFFLHPELPTKYPRLCDSLHAGWASAFSKVMAIEDLPRPPEVGRNAYSEEEVKWCMSTIDFLSTGC